MKPETFTCEKFPIPIPAELSEKFCAKRHRKATATDPCFDCEKGKSAAKGAREMANKKECSCGCGKGAVKDGLATKCYRKKFGEAPFGGGQKKAAKPKPGKKAASARKIRGNSKISAAIPAPGLPTDLRYVIAVDFGPYPKLHERLLELAGREHRTPDMQLLHLFDETLAQGEKAIK